MRKEKFTKPQTRFVKAMDSATCFAIKNKLLPKQLRWFISMMLLLTTSALFGQLSGTKTIGNVGLGDDYGSLTAAFNAIQSNTLNGDISLQLTASYNSANEPGLPINAPSILSIRSFNVKVYPTVSGLSISGNSATGILNLSGTKNITIDGRVNATGSIRDLVIENSDITTGYTIQLINDAIFNTINYCTIKGGTTVATGLTKSGVILFGTGATTGNSNNTISNCEIRDAIAGFPQIAINSIGTDAFPNANNTISNNNIQNFWHPTLASRGIDLGVGNTGWEITANSFFQNATRTSAASVTQIQTIININSTSSSGFSGYTITDNYIGGNGVGANGTWTIAGFGLYRFVGMQIITATSPLSSIQNNLIRNINISTNINVNPVFAGIIVQNGSFNIGTVSGNVIGQPTGNGSVTLTIGGNAATPTTALQAYGIWMTATATGSSINVSNNQIGSFTLDAATVNHALGFEGIIASSGSATAINITNNTVGSTVTANSINSPTLSVTGAQLLRGIDVQNTITGGNINVAINSNIVANMNQNSTLYSVSTGGTGANIRGIVCSPSAAGGTVTCNSNQVYNISGAGATAPSFSSQGSVTGIVMFATGTTNTVTVADNVVHDIRGTNNGAKYYAVAGIVGSNATSANFLRNKIYNLSNASTINSSTTPPIAAGFWFGASGGDYTYVNNMVTLGTGQTTNTMFCGFISAGNSGATRNLYYNTFKITGSAASGALPSWGILRTASLATAFGAAASAGGSAIIIKNNLIDNNRNGGTGKHYALGNISASGSTGWGSTASNFNILNSTSPSAMAAWGVNPGTDYTLATFRTLTGGEASSLTGVAVTFLNPALGDLHINMGVTENQIESTGTPIVTPTYPVAYTTDYDGQARPDPVGSVNGGGKLPDIGADEFDGVILDITAPTIAYTPLSNTSPTSGRTLTNFATITDQGRVEVTLGLRPRIYYKRSTDPNTFNDNTSGTTGWKYAETNGISSPFSFSIDYTKLSGSTGVAVGTVIQYFVIAQDIALPIPNVAINSGIFGSIPTSVNLTSTAFPVAGALNSYTIVPSFSGIINVGTGESITSLTNPNGLFDLINNSSLAASVVLNITSDLTAETGVIGLNQFVEDGIGGYTLTIQPTGNARIISGIPSTPSLIKLNGADRVTINGSLNGAGNDRSLSIINNSQDYLLGNIYDNCVIHVSSPTSTNGANNNTIKNCIIRGLSSEGTEYVIAQGGSDVNGDPGSSALALNNNNTYHNNLIYAANFGIFLNGSSANPDQNTVINENVIGAADTSLNIYYSGIWSQGEVGLQIIDNNISGITGDLSFIFAISGVFINGNCANLVLTGNNITNIKNTSATGGAAGIRLGAFGTSANMLIANNSIADISAVGTAASPTETNNGYGIVVTSGNGYKIYYNSINLTTNQTRGTSAAFCTTSGVSTAGAVDLRNNSFANAQTTNTPYAIYVSGSSSIFSNIDRNIYYSATGIKLGSINGKEHNTLVAWQVATGHDSHSLNIDPLYSTPVFLRPLAGSPAYGAGVPLVDVTSDQAGFTRDGNSPSIGAFESAFCGKTTKNIFANICAGTSYNFHGRILTVSGSYYDTLVGGNYCGFDSITHLHLTVLPNLTTTTNVTICSNELPYHWNGITFTTGGRDTVILNSVDGCDSTAILVLTVKMISASTNNIAICPSGLPYIWNGLIFTSAGTQTKTFIGGNQAGCDSTATLILSVNATSFSDTTVVICNSFFWNDSTYKISGDHIWHGINSVGCDSMATLHLTILSISSTFAKTDAQCFGSSTGSITITPTSGVAPYTYRIGTVGAYGTNNTFTNLKAGSYRVFILDATGCAGTSAQIIIGQQPAVTATFTKTDVVGCRGTATGSIIVTPTSGVSPYSYKLGTSGSYGTTNTFSSLAAGTYNIYILDGNGCPGSISVQITQQPALTASFSITDVTGCRGGTNGEISIISATGTPHITYRFGTTGSYSTNTVFTGLKAGFYTFFIKDANGCVGTSSATVSQPTVVGGNVATTNISCFHGSDGSITISGTGGTPPYQYRYGTSAPYSSVNTFTGLRAGAYNIYVKDASGCIYYTKPALTEPATPVSATLTKVDATCLTSTDGSITINATGGTPPYEYKFGTGGVFSRTNPITGVKMGSYFIYTRDANGCLISNTITINSTNQTTPVTLSYVKTDLTCKDKNDGTITLTGAGSVPPYIYRLGTVGSFTSTNFFNNLKPASYRAYVQDASGCGGTSVSISILQSQIPCFQKDIFVSKTGTNNNLKLEVLLSPNPTASQFTMVVHAPKQDAVQVRIMDVNGKTVYNAKTMPEHSLRIGESFISGVYMIEVRQGDQVKTLKAVKVR